MDNSIEAIVDKYVPNHILMGNEAYNDALLELDTLSIYKMQSEILKLQGKGKDLIWLAESTRGSNAFTDYESVLAYDIPWAAFQNDHSNATLRSALCSTPKFYKRAPDEYNNSLNGERLRLMYLGVMHYCEMYSADNYILSLVDESVDKWLDRKYPFDVHIRTLSSEMSTVIDDNSLMISNSFNYQAFSSCRNIFSQWWAEYKAKLNKELRKMTPATYMIEERDEHGLPLLTVVCRNEGAMGLVRPKDFIADVVRMRANEAELRIISERYSRMVISRFISAGY